jgi:hypothetical protein
MNCAKIIAKEREVSEPNLVELGNRVVSMKAIFKLISDRSASSDGLNEVMIKM